MLRPNNRIHVREDAAQPGPWKASAVNPHTEKENDHRPQAKAGMWTRLMLYTQLENTHETRQSSRDEGLLLLYGLERSSLVPGPEAKSSLEITNLPPFTVSAITST